MDPALANEKEEKQGVSGKASSLLRTAFSGPWMAVSGSEAWNRCNHLVTLRRPSPDAIREPGTPPTAEPASLWVSH